MLLPLWSHRQSIAIINARVVDILASLSLKLLRLLLVELLDEGTYQIKDTRILQSLFLLHAVKCSAPHSGVFQSSAIEVMPNLGHAP